MRKKTIKDKNKIVAEWRRIELDEGIPIVTALIQLKAAALFQVRKELPKIKTPTLVIYGSDDLFVPIKNSIAIHRLIPGSQLCAIAGAGHEVHLNKSSALESAVCDFVRGLKTIRK